MFKYISTLTFLIMVSMTARGQVAKLGQPVLAGSGCPQGSVSVALTPDSSLISILFDSFNVSHAANQGAVLRMNTSCRVQIPVEVPPGYVMDVMKLEYRGFYNVPDKLTRFTLTTSGLRVLSRPLLLALAQQAPQVTKVNGPASSNYQISHSLQRPIRTKCGEAFMLDFTIGMEVEGIMFTRLIRGFIRGDMLATLDSIDGSGTDEGAGAYVGMALKPCR